MERYGLLGQEWQTLQGNHEQHELNALLIKLGCLALSVAGLASESWQHSQLWSASLRLGAKLAPASCDSTTKMALPA